ncbi:GGDEF domain-containing protein [Chitinilyticum aquatile]|uniref:GGDEF domain-containing protein n=1 Tax=Chitinilyticum aquatile TaxID=362520 RepID=UPI0004134815|nr:GGDEF domain-containing protein [Chitinilyticum aquatile]
MKFFRRQISSAQFFSPATVLTLGDNAAAGDAAQPASVLQPGRQHLLHQQIAAWCSLTAACLMLPLHFAFGPKDQHHLVYGMYLLLAAWFGLLAFGLHGRHYVAMIWGQRVLVAIAIPWAAALLAALNHATQPILPLLWPVLGLWLLLLTTSPAQWLFCVLLAAPGLLYAARFGWEADARAISMPVHFGIVFVFLLVASLQMARLRQRVGVVRQRVAEREAHLHAKADRMRKLALRDALTGLSNRLHLMARLRRMLDHGARRNDGATLFLIDLDHFKEINDQHGHDAGDAVLIEVAHRLRHLVRHEDLVSRLGGDEFVLLVEGQLQPEHAELLAAKILQGLAAPCRYKEILLPLGGSVGVAPLHAGIHDPDAWLKEADAAMYLAKHGGRNRYAFSGTAPAAQ